MIQIFAYTFFISKIVLLFLDKKLLLKIQDDQIQLFVGIDNSLDYKSLPAKFYFDFMSENIFLQKNIKCDRSNNCILEDSRIQGPFYFNELEIYCKRSKIFIGLNDLQSDFYFLKKKTDYGLSNVKMILPESQIDRNIIGLAPSSQIWKYWIKNYHPKNNEINLVYVNESHYKCFYIYNLEFKGRNQGIKILKSSPSFVFNLVFFLGGDDILVKQTVSSYISNQNSDLFFKIDMDLYMKFKQLLCKDASQCSAEEDLKKVVDFEFHLKFYINDDINIPQKLEINPEDLYQINQDGTIQWYIEPFLPPQNESYINKVITLEKRFFQKFNLWVSYRDDDNPYMYINLSKVNPYLFQQNTYLSTLSVILITFFFLLFVIYLLTSTYFIDNIFQTKKSIEEEEIEYLEQIIKS